MKRAIYPGTFDPMTNGHIDIVKRAASIFDEVVVAVARRSSKDEFFSYAQRLCIAKTALASLKLKNVLVEGFDGLVVDYARKKKVSVIIRGLRMISDFEYEFQMALTNRSIASDIETIFLMPSPQYSFISSRLIKEAASLGARLSQFLPQVSAKALEDKLARR